MDSESLYVMFEQNFPNVFMAIFKLLMLVSLPFFSFFFVRKNYENLAAPEFELKYGTLYQNLILNSNSVFLFNTFFCLRRFIIGASTIFGNSYLIVNIYVNLFASLFIIKFLFDYRPMNSKMLNFFEQMNEIFILFINYFMFLFTDFIPDVEYRYKLGFKFIGFVGFIFLVNVLLVFIDMGRGMIIQGKRKHYTQKWKEHEKLNDKMINFLVYDALKANPTLGRTQKDIEIHRSVLRENFTFKEMEDKIKSIFENKVRAPDIELVTLGPGAIFEEKVVQEQS